MNNVRLSGRTRGILFALFLSVTVVIFGFLGMNVVYLTTINSTISQTNSRINFHENADPAEYRQFSGNPENERRRVEFASLIQNINRILEIYHPNTGGMGYMDFSYLIASECFEQGLDPYLVLAVIKTESSFRRHVVSQKGAVGFMQLLPDTAFYVSDMHASINLNSREELFDTRKNVKIGISYLAYLFSKYKDKRYALIAYNMGPNRLNRIISNGGQVSDKYYRTVMNNYDRIIRVSSEDSLS